MITYFSNNIETLVSGRNKVEYLPKWALDEKIYNCDNDVKIMRKYFDKFLSAVLAIF